MIGLNFVREFTEQGLGSDLLPPLLVISRPCGCSRHDLCFILMWKKQVLVPLVTHPVADRVGKDNLLSAHLVPFLVCAPEASVVLPGWGLYERSR